MLPFAPMVVPARMVVGHMSWLAFTAAIAIDLFATAALILLAARIYERSILQTGARVKITRVQTAGFGQHRRVVIGGAGPTCSLSSRQHRCSVARRQRSRPLAAAARAFKVRTFRSETTGGQPAKPLAQSAATMSARQRLDRVPSKAIVPLLRPPTVNSR